LTQAVALAIVAVDMKLTEYLAEQRGRCARVARKVGIAAAYLSQMAAGDRPVPAELAPDIEEACEHRVRLWDLRPNDWYRIWRHLREDANAPPIKQPAAAMASVGKRGVSGAPTAADKQPPDASRPTHMWTGDRRIHDRETDGSPSSRRER